MSKFRSKNLKASLMSFTRSLFSDNTRCFNQSERALYGNFIIIGYILYSLCLHVGFQENNEGQTAVDRHAIKSYVLPRPRLLLCCILVECGFSLYDRNHDKQTQVRLVTHKRLYWTALAVKKKQKKARKLFFFSKTLTRTIWRYSLDNHFHTLPFCWIR